MTPIETELKWALAAAGYARLQTCLPERLGPGRWVEQENRFFDTADRRLRSAGMNLRLRREGEILLLTCKRRLPPGTVLQADLSRHEEWEQEVSGSWVTPFPDLAEILRLPLPEMVRVTLAGAPVEALGGFANRRWECRTVDDELICLDATRYGERVDYELEIETEDPATSRIRWTKNLHGWEVAWQAQAVSKFARFLAYGG